MKNILICPLDWGIGHATRVQQVSSYYHRRGHNVFVAASPDLLKLYNDSICSHRIIFSSARVRYFSRMPQYLAIVLQAPVLIIQMLSDHYRLSRLIKKLKIDIVISDNRFGAWNKNAWSVYITHQLTIKTPRNTGFAGNLLSALHRLLASIYNEVWIPDIEGGLTGELSGHNKRLSNAKHIGILSMLGTCQSSKPSGLTEDSFYAVLISGPEPQRSILEKRLIRKISRLNHHFVVAGGNLAEKQNSSITANITHFSYLAPGEIKYLLENCHGVICRAGYSTLMDLAWIGKSGIIIPTPGQTEQEYLAKYLDAKGWFKELKQDETNLIEIDQIPGKNDFENIRQESRKLFNQVMDDLIRRTS